MTSASAPRPVTATMASTSRPSRFPNFAMGNGTGNLDKPSAPIGSSFSGAGWQSGRIWGNGGIGLPKRDSSDSRASESSFSNAPTGSGALAATSEADPWSSRNGPWNNTELSQPQTTSGNTSPSHTRDNGTPLNSDSSFFSPAQPLLGRRPGSFASRSRPGSGLDPSSGSFHIGQEFYGAGNTQGSNSPFGRRFETENGLGSRPDRRLSQDQGFGNGTNVSSRDPSMPPSRSSAIEQASPYSTFGSIGSIDAFGPSAIGAQRPFATPQSSTTSAALNTRIYTPDEETEADLNANFNTSLSLDGPVHRASAPSFPSQQFPRNPQQTSHIPSAAQPWDSPRRFVPNFGLAQSPGLNPEAAPVQPSFGPRGLVPDRSSPALHSNRTGLAEQRHLNGDALRSDVWGPPSLQEASLAQTFDNRQPSQAASIQQLPQYLSPPFYQNNYAPQYSPVLVDQYGVPQTVRHPMQYSGYGYPYLNGVPPTRPVREQDSGKSLRSQLLEEYRSSSRSSRRFELKDIYRHVVEFSGDQHGSRFIQQKLETANSDEKEQLFKEILPNSIQLMKDVFGNYVIQKLFEHGNQVQKKLLAGSMKGKVADLSMQTYACRVVQKALEHVLVEQQAELTSELKPDILRVVKDSNGNHVVQKIIEIVPQEHIGFIIQSFRGRVSELATHTFACRVIQRLLEHGTQEDLAVLTEELHACSELIITDQFGNYVAQHIIEHGAPENKERMIQLVLDQFLTLSKHKYASNVVEKCIEFGSEEDRRRILQELLAPGPSGSSTLEYMIRDQFGNYVVQKLLHTLQGADQARFIEAIRPHCKLLKSNSNSRQVQAIDKLLDEVNKASHGKTGSMSSSSAASRSEPASGSSLPVSPGDQPDAPSILPTPMLTMEPNTPQSSSPPSTNASAVGETVTAEDKTTPKVEASELQLNEA